MITTGPARGVAAAEGPWYPRPPARRALARLAQLVPTFLGITLLTFALTRLAPGDPSSALGELGATPQSLAAWRELRGEGPVLAQYAEWLGRVLSLDLGRSFIGEEPVTALIARALPQTLLVAGAALVTSYALAVPLGILAAARRRRFSGRVVSALSFLFYSLPPFWVALALAVTLAAGEPWAIFPLRGLARPELAGAPPLARLADVAMHLVLPVVCLALPLVARSARMLRTSLVEVLELDFVRAARARGLSERRILWRHALPNAVLPLAALLVLDIPYLVGGSVVVERVFTIRGMGMLAFEAILRRDYPVILGVTVVVAVVTMAALALADVLQLALDPRSRRRVRP